MIHKAKPRALHELRGPFCITLSHPNRCVRQANTADKNLQISITSDAKKAPPTHVLLYILQVATFQIHYITDKSAGKNFFRNKNLPQHKSHRISDLLYSVKDVAPRHHYQWPAQAPPLVDAHIRASQVRTQV